MKTGQVCVCVCVCVFVCVLEVLGDRYTYLYLSSQFRLRRCRVAKNLFRAKQNRQNLSINVKVIDVAKGVRANVSNVFLRINNKKKLGFILKSQQQQQYGDEEKKSRCARSTFNSYSVCVCVCWCDLRVFSARKTPKTEIFFQWNQFSEQNPRRSGRRVVSNVFLAQATTSSSFHNYLTSNENRCVC